MFPFNKHEPNWNSDELQRLDAIADAIKIKRLTNHRCLRHACRFTWSLHTFCENMGGETWWFTPTKLVSSLMFGCKRVCLDGCRKRLFVLTCQQCNCASIVANDVFWDDRQWGQQHWRERRLFWRWNNRHLPESTACWLLGRSQHAASAECSLVSVMVVICGIATSPSWWNLSLVCHHTSYAHASSSQWQPLLCVDTCWWYPCNGTPWLCLQKTVDMPEGQLRGANATDGETGRWGAFLEAQDGATARFQICNPSPSQTCPTDVQSFGVARKEDTWTLWHGPVRQTWTASCIELSGWRFQNFCKAYSGQHEWHQRWWRITQLIRSNAPTSLADSQLACNSSRHCSMVPDPTQGLAQTWIWLQTFLDVEKHTHLQVQRNF